MKKLAAVPLVLILLCACGAANRSDADAQRLVEICKATTNLPAGTCDCVGARAAANLSANARAFLVASMDKQESKAEELRSRLTLPELTQAGMFFVTAPAECAGADQEGK